MTSYHVLIAAAGVLVLLGGITLVAVTIKQGDCGTARTK